MPYKNVEDRKRYKETHRENQRKYEREYRERNPELCRQMVLQSRLKHPDYPDYRYAYYGTNLYRKYQRFHNYSWRHGLPYSYLRIELWNSSKIRVARESNGRFISWKEVA